MSSWTELNSKEKARILRTVTGFDYYRVARKRLPEYHRKLVGPGNCYGLREDITEDENGNYVCNICGRHWKTLAALPADYHLLPVSDMKEYPLRQLDMFDGY